MEGDTKRIHVITEVHAEDGELLLLGLMVHLTVESYPITMLQHCVTS